MEYGKYQEVVDHVQSIFNAEDFAHTIRVLNYALQILNTEEEANIEVTILAAIMHDVGRIRGRNKNHNTLGSKRSFDFLVEKGYSGEVARHVADCVLTHSSDSETKPQTLEAKIVYDADKLDMVGAVGTVRIISQCRKDSIPLYVLDKNNLPAKGKKSGAESLLTIYKQELSDIAFYTKKAKKIAAKHKKIADGYFKGLTKELSSNYEKGKEYAKKYL